MRRTKTGRWLATLCVAGAITVRAAEQSWWKPYRPPQVERENVFAFTEKPTVKLVGPDRHEISFAVKGYCDVAVAIVDPDPARELVKGRGTVVRHLASGVLGSNAPTPFRKNSLKQTVVWDGKDDLDWYVEKPEQMTVRVMLGLKPEFGKRLGGTSPHNIPGRIHGLAASPEGVFVFSTAHRVRLYIRHFDRDARYVRTLTPPPADFPESKLEGMGYIEYEPGKRAVHAPNVYQTVADHQRFMQVNKYQAVFQPVVVSGKAFFVPSVGGDARKNEPSTLHYIHADGSTSLAGMRGRPVSLSFHRAPMLAASPDGKWIYMTEDGSMSARRESNHHVLRMSTGNQDMPTVFAGMTRKPGSDDKSLNGPGGLDTDAQGRLYVCDYSNNRIQVFNADGSFFKTIPIDRPLYIAVHKKTGALYVQHFDRVKGQSVRRTVKLISVENPKPVAHLDGPHGLMALDSWSARPRLWFSGGEAERFSSIIRSTGEHVVTVWEEAPDGTFSLVANFDELAKKEEGEFWAGRSDGRALGNRIMADPVRETVYVGNSQIFNLTTCKLIGQLALPRGIDDIAIDKRGYMHMHFNPTFHGQGVGRWDVSRSTANRDGHIVYPETPYDYGVEFKNWIGILPTKCQGGAKGFQDGIGVNMRGEVAVQSNIYYVPRMERAAFDLGWGGTTERMKMGTGRGNYEEFLRSVQDREKDGEQVYFIRRQPGLPLAGGTVWTFDVTGELRKELAVLAGHLMAGVLIDEDLALYFSTSRPRVVGPGHALFLAGRGGTYGAPDDASNRNPYTGTFVKTQPDTHARMLEEGAAVRLEPLPDRPVDLWNSGAANNRVWAEGVEWLFAGASPIVAGGCSCPSHRAHLDWYKRSFVPQAYRHSIAALDTAGNLILQIGQYGNYDSVGGPNAKIPVGGDGIAMSGVRFISGTDNFLVFDNHGEGVTVLNLTYHAEATEAVGTRP